MSHAELYNEIIPEEERKDFREFLSLLLFHNPGKFLLRNDILLSFLDYCREHDKSEEFKTSSTISGFISLIQEAFSLDDYLCIMWRFNVGRYRFFQIRSDCAEFDEIDLPGYLLEKEQYVLGRQSDPRPPSIDFSPFYDYSPSIRDPQKTGDGIAFLNKYLSSSFFSRPEKWHSNLFEFIKLHKHNDQQLLINGALIPDFKTLTKQITRAIDWLSTQALNTSFSKIDDYLRKNGFEPGWGNSVQRVNATMQSLIDLINEPSDALLERFLSQIPMPLISKIVIISPHGWFGQDNVLGKPDTGGQVIYILDQVKALERHLIKDIELSGLNVTPDILIVTRLIPQSEGSNCHLEKEKVHGTKNCWILRVPFKEKSGQQVDQWISRFRIWPYLERFSEDAATRICSELNGRPDLIIGNYSDGNLVASLLSKKLDVIQCTIAHALEKSKYLFSDLYWNEYEPDYHFSLQFLADLIAMNKSDFIITSSLQEISGTAESLGQYESYQFFTLPGLFRVESGINLFIPKFNVIPPGVDEELYFPYFETEKRIEAVTRRWEARLFHEKSDEIFGVLTEPSKSPIFTMARFDRIKNISGLIEAFGLSQTLQENYNLIFAAGSIHYDRSSDDEERAEIKKAYELIEQYKLYGKVRWLPSINKLETGEVYRIIADHRGIFVQPALFEAFGLTILEAMSSGLPTFGPKFGGPREIITPESGFLLNTSQPNLIAEGLEDFVNTGQKNPDLWKNISRGGIERVKSQYTWALYSQKLINLTKIYGFWRYSVSGKEKMKLDRYSDLVFQFLLKQRADI